MKSRKTERIKDKGEEENQKFRGGIKGADGAKGRNMKYMRGENVKV